MKFRSLNEQDRPRVVHLLTSLNFGGVETIMQLIGENEDSSVFEHHFCVIGAGGRVADELVLMGKPVHLLGQPVRIPSLRALGSLFGTLKKVRPALVHCHGAEANFHGAVVTSVLRIPLVCEEIGLPRHSNLARAVFRWVYQRASLVIAVSEATKTSIVAMREATAHKVIVIASPARLSEYKPRKRSRGNATTLAFIGRLEPIKNLGALIEAMALLKDSDRPVSLRLFGDGSLREKIQNQVDLLGLSSQISLYGYVSHPVSQLDEAQFLIQPSFSEGLSIALVEAMSAGIPPVITPAGGGTEIVKNGVTGWLLDGLGPEAIASKIFEVSSKKLSEINKVGKAASVFVSSQFGVTRYIHELDEVYKSLLEGRD